MRDGIAGFPLRGATPSELGASLGRCFAEFGAWCGQAQVVANFAHNARIGGVGEVLAARADQLLEFGVAEGILKLRVSDDRSADTSRRLAAYHLGIAEQGVKISAIVMLHSSYERFLWRLTRFGLVGNRRQVVKWIGRQSVSVGELLAQDQDVNAIVDRRIETWWEKLERETLLAKWDRLVGLLGHPAKLSDPPWHFDRGMVARFDGVRHNAVHHDAQAVKAFDFEEFGNQLWRAQWVWIFHVATVLNVKIPAESLVQGR